MNDTIGLSGDGVDDDMIMEAANRIAAEVRNGPSVARSLTLTLGLAREKLFSVVNRFFKKTHNCSVPTG